MDVSVVIPSYNEEKNIRDCLNSLIKQNYNTGKYEIIVVDGRSRDKTQDIVQKFLEKYSNIMLVIEPKKGAAAGRNAGIKATHYDYVAFIDADCEAPSNWLTTLVNNFKTSISKNDKLVAVGGRNIPPENGNRFLRAIGVALDSFMGSFSSVQGRQFVKETYVSSLATLNVIYDKKKLIDIGGFDESLNSEGEDAELNFRLFSAGYKFLFVPDSFVWHKMRLTPATWFKNMFRYGKARARLLKRYPEMWKWQFALPLIFILAMFSLLLIPFSRIFLLPVLYFPLLASFSFFQAIKKKSLNLFIHVMFIYIIQHFGYAVGEIYGLIYPKIK